VSDRRRAAHKPKKQKKVYPITPPPFTLPNVGACPESPIGVGFAYLPVLDPSNAQP